MFRELNPCEQTGASKLSLGDFAKRRRRFVKELGVNSVAIIVSNPEQTRSNDSHFPFRQSSDLLYLSGFNEPESVLVLCNIKGEPRFTMLVRPRDRKAEIWNGIRAGVEGAKKDFGADAAYPVDKFIEVVGALIGRAERVYYKYGRNSKFDALFDTAWKSSQKPLSNPEEIIHEMRLFKESAELDVMRQAGRISAEAHCEAMRACRPGLREYQLEAMLAFVFRWNGADGPAYTSIVGGGKNAVILHYVDNSKKLKDGDLVLIDAACEFMGYASDITRTFPVNGKFTKAQREIYEIVLDAQLAAIKAAKPGVPLAAVHLAAQVALCKGLVRLGILPSSALVGDYLAKYGKGKYSGENAKLHLNDLFMHGTSHWLGLDVHDVGDYQTADGTRSDKGRGKQRILKPGMCITVEPGLYFEKSDKRIPKRYRGIGVRIEDDIVITKDGNEVLTASVPKKIKDIEQLMSAGSAAVTKHAGLGEKETAQCPRRNAKGKSYQK